MGSNWTLQNMNIFISNLARNEVVPQNQHWANSNNRPQIFNAMKYLSSLFPLVFFCLVSVLTCYICLTVFSKNARVISDFQHWYSEILNRNDFTSSKATEVFTCFVNAIIAKHTPPECHNLPENYQKVSSLFFFFFFWFVYLFLTPPYIMMKCVCEMFSDDFFPAILNVFKTEVSNHILVVIFIF